MANLNPSQTKGSARQSDAYLSELLSYSLDRLRKEPDLLKEEKQAIEKGIQGTAVNNYGAFIETSGCLETINAELGAVCDRLDMLLQVQQLSMRDQPYNVIAYYHYDQDTHEPFPAGHP